MMSVQYQYVYEESSAYMSGHERRALCWENRTSGGCSVRLLCSVLLPLPQLPTAVECCLAAVQRSAAHISYHCELDSRLVWHSSVCPGSFACLPARLLGAGIVAKCAHVRGGVMRWPCIRPLPCSTLASALGRHGRSLGSLSGPSAAAQSILLARIATTAAPSLLKEGRKEAALH